MAKSRSREPTSPKASEGSVPQDHHGFAAYAKKSSFVSDVECRGDEVTDVWIERQWPYF